MSRREEIKDFYGRIIGFLDYESNGDIIARDLSYRILGRYDAAMDVTKDFYGKILYKGNMVGALFR